MSAAKKSQPDRESPEVLRLRGQLEQLRQEADRLKDIAGRAQADLQNAKERLERERQEISKFALVGAVTRLLPTLDNLQRSFQHLPEEFKEHERACPELVEWVKGIVAIESDLVRVLGDLGLQRMESTGKMLDPAKHEALQAGPGAKDKILEVFEEGYEFNGKVLRPSKVKVGDGSGAA